MKPGEFAYLAKYGFDTLVLRQKKPIIAGIPLTDVCNLQCKHCVVANVGRGHYPFPRIEQLLHHFFNAGVRFLFLQGGEIMTWRDGTLNVNDVIHRAREIGFFKIAAVTNGTLGIATDADLMWVSLDGLEQMHDSIRGAGAFGQVMRHLKETRHPHVSLNMTINRLNAGEVEAVASLARELPTVHGVSFNFQTPYPGVDEFALSPAERVPVLERIINLKRHGLPVLNTKAGLEAMKKNKWRRPVSIIQLVEQDRIFECCWGREHPGVCQNCGYGIIAEISQVLSGNVAAIMGSLSLFN